MAKSSNRYTVPEIQPLEFTPANPLPLRRNRLLVDPDLFNDAILQPQQVKARHGLIALEDTAIGDHKITLTDDFEHLAIVPQVFSKSARL